MRFSLFARLIGITPFLIAFFLCLGVLLGIIPVSPNFNRTFVGILTVISFGYVLAMLWGFSRYELAHPQPNNTNVVTDVRKPRMWVLFIVQCLVGGLFVFIALKFLF